MSANTFNRFFRITTAGESHGPAMGVIIDGCPPGVPVDPDFLLQEMRRRRPGQSALTTARDERDEVRILSGVHQGMTTGAPILLVTHNEDARPADYMEAAMAYRPSHADYTYEQKYGIRDPRGGGRSSARETLNWVAAGAFAKMLLRPLAIEIHAGVTGVGPVESHLEPDQLDWDFAETHPVRCPDPAVAADMEGLIRAVRDAGDTVGGRITCVITGCPPGLGDPVFHKLHADLGHAMLTINACKGFAFGSGFAAARMQGSRHNDVWVSGDDGLHTVTNHSGGIQGGIANGMPIVFQVAFKPVSTLMIDQQTVNTEGEHVTLSGKGRHDPCVAPRAVPVVEAMAALVLADHWLSQRAYHGVT